MSLFTRLIVLSSIILSPAIGKPLNLEGQYTATASTQIAGDINPANDSLNNIFYLLPDSVGVSEDPIKPYEKVTPSMIKAPAFRNFVEGQKQPAYNSAGQRTRNFSRGVYYVGERKFVVCE